MPRRARKLSDTKIYHIVFRGINKQNIFIDEEDYKKLLNKLAYLKKEMSFEIYAYCLMSNHAHILIKEKNWGDISLILKRLLISYALYFNNKYQRIGKLINDRYLSIPVKNDAYILNLVRYIHQNPEKIGLSINYKWSSFKDYFNTNNRLLDNYFILELINEENFLKFHNIKETLVFEPCDKLTLSDNEIKQDILSKYSIDPIQISGLDKNDRNIILSSLRESYSISQISRITGITKNIVARSRKNNNTNKSSHM